MTRDGKRRFIFLDGLRGIAALAVGWLHSADLFQLSFRPRHAGLAVDFFFVLSGFVIAYAYDGKLADGMTFSDFAIRRIIRLYPLIFLGVILGTLVSITLVASPHTDATRYLTFGVAALLIFPLGSLSGMAAYPVNFPIWSLFFELVANAVYGWARVKRFSGRLLVPALIVAALALCGVVGHYRTLGSVWGSGKPVTQALSLVHVGYPFLAGVLIYRYRLYAPRLAGLDVALALTLITVFAIPYFIPSGVYDLACVLLLFPLLICVGAHASTHPVLTPIWKISGDLSYPFYLLHLPLLTAASALLRRHPVPGISPGMAAFLGITLTAAIAYLAVLVYDRPVRAWLTATYGRWHAGHRASSTESQPLVSPPWVGDS